MGQRHGMRPLADALYADGDEAEIRCVRSLPVQVWVSDAMDAEAAQRAWAEVSSERTELSVFMATEEAGLFDVPGEELYAHALSMARAGASGSLAPLPCPDWVAPLVERQLADPELRPLLAAEEPVVWPTYAGEGPVRVVACSGHPALGPLVLGWRWRPEMAARVATLWEVWYARSGFRPVVVGMSSLDAYAPTPPTDLTSLRALVREQLSFCPDLGQGDAPVVSALRNALGHQWRFWWD